MNKKINIYLITGYLKIITNFILIFFCLGFILNLFEEIDFFKNLDESFTIPLFLNIAFIPGLIFDLMPFIIFFSTVWYLISLKNNSDLLSCRIFGYSNLKIIFVISVSSFFLGVVFITMISPITSSLTKYYELKKAKYSIDTDHLVSITKNGVWIKEKKNDQVMMITGSTLKNNALKNVTIFYLDKDYKIFKRLESPKAIIDANPWTFEKVKIYNIDDSSINPVIEQESFNLYTENTLEKINSVYKNLDTISFIDLMYEYKYLKQIGYKTNVLNEKMHEFFALPIFLFFMSILASIFTISIKKNSKNTYYVILAILTCVFIYYFKDLSIALGKTERISLVQSVWIPVISIGLICGVGVIQINEK